MLEPPWHPVAGTPTLPHAAPSTVPAALSFTSWVGLLCYGHWFVALFFSFTIPKTWLHLELCAPAPPHNLKPQTTGRMGTFKLETPMVKTASVSRMIEPSGFLQNDFCPSLRGIADPWRYLSPWIVSLPSSTSLLKMWAIESYPKKLGCRDSPGGSVAKTLRSSCWGPGFNPWWGN